MLETASTAPARWSRGSQPAARRAASRLGRRDGRVTLDSSHAAPEMSNCERVGARRRCPDEHKRCQMIRAMVLPVTVVLESDGNMRVDDAHGYQACAWPDTQHDEQSEKVKDVSLCIRRRKEYDGIRPLLEATPLWQPRERRVDVRGVEAMDAGMGSSGLMVPTGGVLSEAFHD